MSRSFVQPRATQWPLNVIRLAIVIASLIALGVGWTDSLGDMEEAERATLERATLQARAQARAVGEAVQATLNSFDLALKSVRARAYEGNDALDRQARLALDGVPESFALQIFIIDRDGYLAYSSLGPAPRNYLGDREYFKRLSAVEEDILVVSEPVLGRLTQRWSIQVARAIRRDGVFDGVVSVALSLDTWTAQLMRLDAGPRDTLTLIGREGELLLRSLHGGDYYGKQIRLQHPFVTELDAHEGHYVSKSWADGVRRVYGWSRLSSGLIMTSGIAVEDALEPVRQAQEGAVFRAFMLSGVFIIAVLALLFALGRYGHAMRRLALREAHTRNLLEHMVEGIMVVDANQRIIAVNPALCEISGYREAELLGASPALLSGGSPGAGGLMDLLAGEEDEAAARGGDFQALRPGGTPYTAHARVSVVSSENGGGTNRLVLIADVTELRRKTDEIWQRANFDVVTGLPNRALLHDRLERMIRHARRQQTHVLILFVDLDRFKPVNDTYGHEFGDRLLVEVGRRLEGLFREEDTVGRLGGDEFVVLIPATHGHELAGPAALKVVEQLSQPFEIDGQGVDISASVGVACFPDDGDVPEDLIAAADAAMYRAKHAGRATWRA